MPTENFAETHRNVAFSNNVTATLRDMPGQLYPLCGTMANYAGNKKARIENRFGRLQMIERSTRNPDTDNVDIDSVARFIAPGKMADVAPILDPDDALVTEVDLGSPLVKEVADAAKTYHDDMFIRGFFGSGWSGENGDVAVPFKSTNQIAHGGVGITKAKLLALAELMRKRHVNLNRERPIILLQPEDVTSLMLIEEYVNSRYGEGEVLARGELKPWLYFRFMDFVADAESLPTSFANIVPGTGTRFLPVILPSGMHRGVWKEFEGHIDRLPTKGQAMQFWGGARSACVRTDEDRAFILQTQ